MADQIRHLLGRESGFDNLGPEYANHGSLAGRFRDLRGLKLVLTTEVRELEKARGEALGVSTLPFVLGAAARRPYSKDKGGCIFGRNAGGRVAAVRLLDPAGPGPGLLGRPLRALPERPGGPQVRFRC